MMPTPPVSFIEIFRKNVWDFPWCQRRSLLPCHPLAFMKYLAMAISLMLPVLFDLHVFIFLKSLILLFMSLFSWSPWFLLMANGDRFFRVIQWPSWSTWRWRYRRCPWYLIFISLFSWSPWIFSRRQRRPLFLCQPVAFMEYLAMVISPPQTRSVTNPWIYCHVANADCLFCAIQLPSWSILQYCWRCRWCLLFVYSFIHCHVFVCIL